MRPASLTRLFTAINLVIVSSGLMASDDGVMESGWSVTDWTILTSVYTRHFDEEPYHVNDQNLLSVEAGFINGWTAGLAVFENSYGQDSQFLFMGRRWEIRQSDLWYLVLRGGLLHGYEEPYQDKIPLNGLGIAPAIIPALGFKYRNFVSELNIAGTAAVTLTMGFSY